MDDTIHVQVKIIELFPIWIWLCVVDRNDGAVIHCHRLVLDDRGYDFGILGGEPPKGRGNTHLVVCEWLEPLGEDQDCGKGGNTTTEVGCALSRTGKENCFFGGDCFRAEQRYFTMGRDVFQPLLLLWPGSMFVARNKLLGPEVFRFLPAVYAGQSATGPRLVAVTAVREQEPPQSLSNQNQMGKASGVDVRDSTGLDDDGGSRVLKAGGCAGNFCRMRFPPGFLRIACGSNCNARPTLPPRLGVFLDSEAQDVPRYWARLGLIPRYPATRPQSPLPLRCVWVPQCTVCLRSVFK